MEVGVSGASRADVIALHQPENPQLATLMYSVRQLDAVDRGVTTEMPNGFKESYMTVELDR